MHHVNKYFNQTMVIEALKMSFYKLNPKQLIKNPIMFVVEVGMLFNVDINMFFLTYLELAIYREVI